MSVEDLSITKDITTSLYAALDKADTIKTADTGESPLSASSFESDLEHLKAVSQTPDDNTSQSSRNAVFEYAARNIFYPLVATNLDDNTFTTICNFFDFLQLCADHSLCDATLVLLLIEELLDGQTIDCCRRVFDYLESRRDRLITNGFSQGKKLIVLRTCNELLRRLSRAEDAVFCGRVFMFLFQSFPLGDKSAVNLRGEFHTENVTVFDELVGKDTKDEMEVDVEVKQEVQVESKPPPTGPAADKKEKAQSSAVSTPAKGTQDVKEVKVEEPEIDMDTLYTRFWSLQRVFADPRLAFSDAELATFKGGLEVTLKKFKSVPKILQTRSTALVDAPGNSLKRKRSIAGQDEFASNFNPKYLTNRDLFDLEISDLTFQRHILVQALIFLDFLLSLTPQAKKRQAKLKVQKAMLYDYTLSPENTEWATKTRAAIAEYLQEGPDGKYYYRMIDNVLTRDKNWVRWKTESCPPISLPPLKTADYLEARRGVKRHCAPRRIKANVMGAMDMSFISDTGDNEAGLAKLRASNKFEAPDVKQYISTAKEVDLDMAMATKEEKPELIEKRASNTWRVLRVMAGTRLSLFDEVDESGDLDVFDEEKMAAKRAEEEEAAIKAEAEAAEAAAAKEEMKNDETQVKEEDDVIMNEDVKTDQQNEDNTNAQEEAAIQDTTSTSVAGQPLPPNEPPDAELPNAEDQPGGDTEQLIASRVVPPVAEVDGTFAAEALENVPEGGGMDEVVEPSTDKDDEGGVSLSVNTEEAEMAKTGQDADMAG